MLYPNLNYKPGKGEGKGVTKRNDVPSFNDKAFFAVSTLRSPDAFHCF